MKLNRFFYLICLLILLALATLAYVQLQKEFAAPDNRETHLGYPF